jgi:DedD protein
MDEHLKRRLVGAVVLVALAVIFVPMLLDEEGADTGITRSNIPPHPEAPFSSRIQPLEPPPAMTPVEVAVDEQAATPVEETAPEAAPGPAPSPNPPAEPEPATPAKPPADTGAIASWIIQVGSFSSQENADKLVAELRAAKFSAFSKKAVVGGETLYRVRVGPEVDQKKAQEILARIEKQFKLKGRLERYP